MTTDDYLFEGHGAVDADVARLEALLGRHAHRATAGWPVKSAATKPASSLTLRRRMRVPMAIAATILLAVGAASAWQVHRLQWPENRPWAITATSGEVRIDGTPLAADATLAPGALLRTGADGAVHVDVARIGRFVLGPQAQVRLDATRSGRHRLQWQGGRLWARVWAPPGQFGVGIAGVQALDLGCEFVVDGEAGGDASLTVRSGWVQIDAGADEVLVPEGATVALPHGAAPGTPHAIDAHADLIAALRTIDATAGDIDPDGDAVRALLATVRSQDAITLLSLLQRHPTLARGPMFDATQALLPDAAMVSREAVLTRTPNALEPWWQALPYPRAKRWWLHWRDALPMDFDVAESHPASSIP